MTSHRGDRFTVNAGGSATNRFTVLATGSVGIGTANPTDTLVASWGTQGNEMHVYNETGSGHGNPKGGFVLSNKYVNSGTRYEGAFIKFGQESATSPLGDLALGTGNGTTTTTTLYLTSTGSVGIGTTTPSDPLTVILNKVSSKGISVANQNSSGGASVGTNNDAGDYFNISAQGSGNSYFPHDGVLYGNKGINLITDGNSSNGGADPIRFLAGGYDTTTQERMRITSSGNVGIGTTSPTAPLDVAGPIRSEADSYVSSDFPKTSSTTLGAITGLSSGTLAAGKAYAFDIWLYTTSNSAGGIKVDLNGGTATATTLIGDSQEWDGTAIGAHTAFSALNTALCAITAVATATRHITGTIIVNAAGTLKPEFAQNASNATASTVKTGSVMLIRQLN